jgi:hypothetical protein
VPDIFLPAGIDLGGNGGGLVGFFGAGDGVASMWLSTLGILFATGMGDVFIAGATSGRGFEIGVGSGVLFCGAPDAGKGLPTVVELLNGETFLIDSVCGSGACSV